MTEENQYMPQTLSPAGVSPSDFPSPDLADTVLLPSTLAISGTAPNSWPSTPTPWTTSWVSGGGWSGHPAGCPRDEVPGCPPT